MTLHDFEIHLAYWEVAMRVSPQKMTEPVRFQLKLQLEAIGHASDQEYIYYSGLMERIEKL